MEQTVHPPELVGMSAERLARIRPTMQRHVDRGQFAGISTMIARRGQVVHFEQVGMRDREGQLPMAEDTICRIYSMTKPIVCTALMTLYEEGRFQLLDPVAKYIPAFGHVRVIEGDGSLHDLDRAVQVRDLMTHASGLAYGFSPDSPVDELYRQAQILDSGRSLEAMVGEIARLPLAFQPGTRWNYGVGIDVAGHLAELISGQPLDQLLRERIFGPLGMHDTGYMVPPGQHSRLAAMYGLQSVDGRSETARLDLSNDHPTNDPRHIRGGHGLYSTARDYMRFAQMLLNRGELDGARILGRKTHALMHMNHLPPHILPEGARSMVRGGWGYGLGSAVMIDVAASGTIGSLGEYGWDGAAKTYYWVDPQEQLVGLLMTQYLGALDAPDQDLRVLAYQALVD